jgi:hypothetical protein
MRTRAAIWLLFAVEVSAASLAKAQLIPQAPHARASIIAGVSLEPDLVLDLGYVQPLPLATSDSELSVSVAGTLGILVLVPPEPQIRSALVALANLSARPWRAACALDLSLTHFADDAASMYGIGAGLRCQPAYLVNDWALGLDVGVQSALTTHIEPTARAGRTFTERYPDRSATAGGPRAGWYAFASQRFRLGLSTQVAWSDYGSLAIALGSLFALQEQGVYFSFNLAHVPFYLELVSRFGW